MKTDPYLQHHINEMQLRKLMEIYGKRPEDELIPQAEVKDIFEAVYYCGRKFHASGESALAYIAASSVLRGENAKAGDIVSKLVEIREDI